MAVIGKIRKYSGLLIAVIGIALAAFVLSDFFKGGGGNEMEPLAVINGDKVFNQEFNTLIEQQIELYKQQRGTDKLTPDELQRIRQQTWSNYLREVIVGEEMEELGIAVSKEELKNIIVGNDPHPYIVQSFTDPSTGQFDHARVKSFWANMDQLEPPVKEQLISMEKDIKKDHHYNKYYNLVKKSIYVNSLQAKEDYKQKNDVAIFEYIMYEYSSINDSSVNLTDADYEAYYQENDKALEQKEFRAVDYVIFDVLPSDKDEQRLKDEIEKIKTDFEATEVSKTGEFVNSASDERYDSTFFKERELAVEIDSIMFNSEVGTVYGPYYADNAFNLAKLVDVQQRPDSMRAEHILITYRGAYRAPQEISRTKTAAKELADSLLPIVKRRLNNFDTLAKQYSDDPSVVQNAGDMDWFADKSGFAHEFKQACIDNNVGDVVIAETMFGYHIVHVTGKTKANKNIRVAFIKLYNEPSDETYQGIYAEASKFAGENQTGEKFQNAVINQGLNKRSADYLKEMDYRIAGLESPREIIRWAYNENTEIGSVSDVFDLEDNKFVVATLKEIRPEGIPSLEAVKDQIKPQVLKKKKADKIKEIIKAEKAGTSDLATLARKLNLQVDSVQRGTFASPNIPRAGREVDVVGSIFGMSKGQLSEPIEGNRGVFVVKLSNKIDAPEIEDYSSVRKKLAESIEQRVNYAVYNALEKTTDIEDNRIIYY